MTALLFIVLAFFSISTEAATSIDQPQQLEAAFSGCHFRLNDRMGGRFRPMTKGFDKNAYYTISSDASKHRRLSPAISFRCENKEGEEKFQDMGVFRKNNVWHIKPSSDDPDNIGNAKIYSLDGGSNIGVAITSDQTTGELEDRNRGLFFCLTNHEQMLCGSSEVIARVAAPKTSVLPEVLEMLKSIEFLDPVEGAFTRP